MPIAERIPLSPRQRELFAFICRYVADNGRTPTMAVMAQALGVRGTSSVFEQLVALERKGWIRRVGVVQKRSIIIVQGLDRCPVCGAPQQEALRTA